MQGQITIATPGRAMARPPFFYINRSTVAETFAVNDVPLKVGVYHDVAARIVDVHIRIAVVISCCAHCECQSLRIHAALEQREVSSGPVHCRWNRSMSQSIRE